MIVTVISWILILVSAVVILCANKISQNEMTREGMQILCALIFCFVGTWQISDMMGMEGRLLGFIRPWKMIGLLLLLVSSLLWWASKRIR